MIKKLFLIVSTLLLAAGITSCTKSNDSTTSNENVSYANVNRVDDIEFSDDIEYEEVELDNPDYLSNTFMDVEPDFKVTLQMNSLYLSDSELSSSVIASECGGDNIELNFSYANSIDASLVNVSAKDGYIEGNAYTIDIEANSNLTFYEKDPSIRSIIFTIKSSDKEDFETISYNDYDFDKVSDFMGYGDYDTYLYYDGEITEDVGSIITFSNDEEKIYIEILAKSIEGNLTKIKYKCPDADKIFTSCDMHIDNKALDMENNFHLNEVEQIAQQLVYSDFVLLHVYAITDQYGFTPAIDKLLDLATISVSFVPNGNKFELGFDISFTFEFDSGWRLCASFKFKWVKSFNASADAKLETTLGIPTGVKMNCAVASDEEFTFQILVSFKNEKFNVGYTEDAPKDLDLKKAKKAVEELKEKWAKAEALGYKRDKVIGDTMMIDIGYVSMYFGYLSIDIDLYLCIKLDANVTIGVAYTYSQHQVIINYSSTNGNGDGGASPSDVSAKALSGSIAGNISTEIYLKLRVSAYFTGLKYLASISIDVDAGVYFTAKGLGSLAYNFTTHEFDTDAAAQLEFGFLFRVKLNINLLWIWNNSWDLYSKKAALLSLGWAYNVKERSSSDTIELNKNLTDIETTNLLVFNVFDAEGLSVMTKTFSYDYKVTYLDSVFISDPLSFDLFKSIRTDNENVTIENGYIIVKEGVAEASGNIIIDLNTSTLTYKTYTVPFHFLSSDAKFVTFDGENKTSYLPGQKVTMPTHEEKEGYIFKGYIYDGETYYDGETFTMGDTDVNFTSRYIVEAYYTVRFYDGLGNLLTTQTVVNEGSAIAPTEYQIEGYHFVSWDKSFNLITGDTDVYGIYEKVGDSE